MGFITRITEYINKNYDLTKDSLLVIFPNKRAALTLRKELSKSIKCNIWLPQMLSIQEAMSAWSKLQLLDNIDVTFELLKILDNSDKSQTRNNLYGLASQMVKDFDEIDQYGVNAEKIFRFLKEFKEADTWTPEQSNSETVKAYLSFFASLYGHYVTLRDVLLKSKSGYYGLLTRTLSELSDNELKERIGDKKIIFAGFNAMTKTEEDIVVRLSELDKAVVLWDLDKYYFEDNKQEAGLFAREFFKKHKHFAPNFLSNNFRDEEKTINIIGVSGSSIQASALQLNLHNEKKDKSQSAKREAVILADESLLIPVLNSIPDSYDNISVTMGYPYAKTIINQFVTQIFPFQKKINGNGNIYFWAFKRLVESEIFKIILNSKESASLSDCVNHFTKQSVYNVTAGDLCKHIGKSKKKRLSEFIESLTRKWESSNDCILSLKSLLRMISDYLPQNENSYFIKNQISVAGRIINKIEKLLDKYELLIQISDIEILYKQSSLESNIKLENNNDGLQIMGLLETRNLDFDRIHVLSVNEGILPQSKSNNSLITNDLRFANGLPTYTNKQAVYAYHFYRLIQNAKEVNIYYNTLADAMGEGEPSRFIRQIMNELTVYPNIKISNIAYKNPDIKISRTTKIEVEKTQEAMAKIINKIGNNHGDRISGISPTSLSCYLKCPLQFYLRYIENIKENETDELIQSNVIGTIIHSTLEILYGKFKNRVINYELYKITVDKYLEESFHKALIKNNFPNGLPETGFNYLTQIMIWELINNFIEHEKNYLRQGNTIEIIGLEKNLSHSFKIDDYTVNLTGYADRIDKTGNITRILDYKTGSIKNADVIIKKKTSNLSELTEKALQLIIYKYLYAKNSDIPAEQIESGIFGLLKMNNVYLPLDNQSETYIDDCFMENCDIMFENIFKEILDKDIPFTQTNNESNCSNCNFLSLCKRSPKKQF